MFSGLCHFSSCMNKLPLSRILLALLVHRASFEPTTNTVSEQYVLSNYAPNAVNSFRCKHCSKPHRSFKNFFSYAETTLLGDYISPWAFYSPTNALASEKARKQNFAENTSTKLTQDAKMHIAASGRVSYTAECFTVTLTSLLKTGAEYLYVFSWIVVFFRSDFAPKL